MRKVIFFTDKVSSSGASKIISWLVNSVNLEDAEMTLATYLPVDDKRQINKNIQRVRLDTFYNNRIKRGFKTIQELRRLFFQNEYSVCVSFLPVESMYAIIAALGTKTKVIVCERSDPFLEKTAVAMLARKMFRFASGAVFQTNEAMSFFPYSLRKKSMVIPNPAFRLNIEYKAYKERDYEIAYSGRLYNKQKRIDVLLHAFRIVLDNNNSVKLCIYGDGPDKEKLIQLASELNILDNVVFYGNITNVEERISQCRLLVGSSDYEGIPNVILEALQSGVPVVSTDCSPGGARLLVREGIDGFVVPRGDYQELARQILKVLNNEELAEQMSKNALDVIDRFSAHEIINLWNKYITSFF